MDCSPPGSCVCGILQARILEWVAIPFSRGSFWPRDWTRDSCIGRQILYRLNHQGSPIFLFRVLRNLHNRLGIQGLSGQENRLPLLHLEPKIPAPDPVTTRSPGLFSPRTLSLDTRLPPLSWLKSGLHWGPPLGLQSSERPLPCFTMKRLGLSSEVMWFARKAKIRIHVPACLTPNNGLLWKPIFSWIRQVSSNHGSAPFLWASPFPSLDLSLLSYKMGIIIQQVSKLQEDSDYICFLHCVLLVFRVGDWDTVCVW